jgi:hypothetical protein
VKNYSVLSVTKLSSSIAVLTLLVLSILAPYAEASSVFNRHHSKKAKAEKMEKPFFRQGIPAGLDHFESEAKFPGIGVDRQTMNHSTFLEREQAISNTYTYSFVHHQDGKDLDVMIWNQRLTDPALQKVITDAANQSGFPKPYLEGLIYAESGGKADARSPTGPKGIAQMSAAFARGVHILTKSVVCAVVPNKKGKKRTQCRALVNDGRLNPVVAIPAAAKDLERMTLKYQNENNLPVESAQQFAIWAYHSGEGIPNQALALAREYGIKDPTAAKLLLYNAPGYNQKLFDLIQKDLHTDFGATYYFGILRASQLLEMYRTDPVAFAALVKKYKSVVPGVAMSVSRLDQWSFDQPVFATRDAIHSARVDGTLVSAPDNPEYFSYALHVQGSDLGSDTVDPPAVVGMLMYIAAEVRRGWEKSHPAGEQFVPLTVTAMMYASADRTLLEHHQPANPRYGFHSHDIGAVDISVMGLPKGERDWFDLVIQDLGFDERIGWYEEPEQKGIKHFAPSPSDAPFFTNIYAEAIADPPKP